MQGYDLAMVEGLRLIGALAFVTFVGGIIIAAMWDRRK